MKIWEINSVVDIYATFFLENDSDVIFLKEKLNKGNYIDNWTSLNIKIDEENPNRPISDSPYIWSPTGLIMISEKAKNIFSKNFEKYIQFIPVFCKENNQNYYILNILNIVDCIDYKKSEFRKFKNKYIVDVEKYVFKENIKSLPIFKIYLDIIINLDNYITDEFKQVIEDNKLEGFEFTELFQFTD